uniref:uncharacterized protein LOC122584981 n=1 Tax=Erigeron canadensis TaxID=72917 RepID=UPI001CB9BCAA|nr:uncharacterized protein LOC122584981 [Erigeron canadensis]
MDGVCLHEQKTVVHELTQGIEMAKKLRVNLNSAEAREFLIQKILSSYENALSVLKSRDSTGQPLVSSQPANSLPESTNSIGSSWSREFEFDYFDQSFFDQQSQNAVSKKRKSPLLPPPSPEKHNKRPCQNHQISPTNPNEMLSNIGSSNHSVTTSATGSPTFSFPSTPFGFMEDYQQLDFQDLLDDEPMQVCSPPFISPKTSESNYFSEWGSSTSLDCAADPADINPDFIFNSSSFF